MKAQMWICRLWGFSLVLASLGVLLGWMPDQNHNVGLYVSFGVVGMHLSNIMENQITIIELLENKG